MAEGFARHYGEGIVEVQSAGTQPAIDVAASAIQVMREKGIDISDQKPEMLTTEMQNDADHVISMGCGVEESCPIPLRSDIKDWGLEDPIGQPIDVYRQIRVEIEIRVKGLLEGLNP
jgi:arsenate reductase